MRLIFSQAKETPTVDRRRQEFSFFNFGRHATASACESTTRACAAVVRAGLILADQWKRSKRPEGWRGRKVNATSPPQSHSFTSLGIYSL